MRARIIKPAPSAAEPRPATPSSAESRPPAPSADPFFNPSDLVPVKQDAARRTSRRAVAEIDELITASRWSDAVELFYPTSEKLPELADQELDTAVRSKLAFCLGQLGRFDEAIEELSVCVAREPDRFIHQTSLAYTAYNSLYAAKNREIALSSTERAERIQMAHRHFRIAQSLRPDGVTNFYREGMLFKQIEDKVAESIPLFEQAVANWDGLDDRRREARHQERKNVIKSLYQLASALLAVDRAEAALETLQRCLEADERRNVVDRTFKYFALGKVHYHLNRFTEAKDALLFAVKCGGDRPADFALELLGRVYMALDQPARALDAVRRVPEKARRPYVRWTEADALCMAGNHEEARTVLAQCCERDRRSRHKGLIRLARIDYLLGDFTAARQHAADADRFFREKWGGACDDGLFWGALAAFRLDDLAGAREMADTLNDFRPDFPKLQQLREAIGAAEAPAGGDAGGTA